MTKLVVNAEDVLRQYTMTVEIRHMRRARVRVWIALRLARLAARIGNFGLQEHEAIGVLVTDKGLPQRGVVSSEIVPIITSNPFDDCRPPLSRGDSNQDGHEQPLA